MSAVWDEPEADEDDDFVPLPEPDYDLPWVEADESWKVDAACRGADPSVFLDVEAREPIPPSAAAYCRSCPVVVACREYGQTISGSSGLSGVWGGEAESDRLAARRAATPERTVAQDYEDQMARLRALRERRAQQAS